MFHDVFDTKGCGHMEDDVGFSDELVDEIFIADIAFMNGDLSFEMADVIS